MIAALFDKISIILLWVVNKAKAEV